MNSPTVRVAIYFSIFLTASFARSSAAEPPPAPKFPPAATFAESVVSGRIDPAAFDFAGAGYWQVAQPDRALWWQGVAAALHLGQPSTGSPCSDEAQREGAAIAWLFLVINAPDADEWAKAAQALRKQLAVLDQSLAAAAPPTKSKADPRVTELLERFARDQAVRMVFTEKKWTEGMPPLAANNWGVAFMSRMTAIDCSNTAWLKAQLAQIHWFDIPTYGAAADNAAWAIVQHADREPEFQRRMLTELEALAPGKTDAKRVGYLWDRVAMADKRPQRYGTQGQCTDKGTWKPNEVEDPEHLDERRAKLGMEPIAEHALTVWREACPK